jgi:hypothetical protein
MTALTRHGSHQWPMPRPVRPGSHAHNNTPARAGLAGRTSKLWRRPCRCDYFSRTRVGSPFPCSGHTHAGFVNQLARKIRPLLSSEWRHDSELLSLKTCCKSSRWCFMSSDVWEILWWYHCSRISKRKYVASLIQEKQQWISFIARIELNDSMLQYCIVSNFIILRSDHVGSQKVLATMRATELRELYLSFSKRMMIEI